ncbi:response regulator [Acidovorax sp. Leaf160]|uniref:response regulator n=1 Tax=Acidovorax sp. Leaf160 TaxID=1736280 RepID=UPI0006FB6895|nr:response regulator [Acidovorax sp. Leaf160]KQR42798.1 two-component system response regulator [Acidovorax sp. Leaf160]
MDPADLPLTDPACTGAVVLLAEDEAEIADILGAYLRRSGLRAVHAADGRQALALHLALKPDLVLLDVHLPQVSGWQVLSELRHRGDTPVIMLTALDQDIDKLMGLRLGADDYVVKPFNPAEVVARVQAVLRRTASQGGRRTQKVLRVGGFQIDPETLEASLEVNGERQVLALTLTEFNLLAHMARAPKRVFSRAELMAACLPESDALERTVDSHISKLRKKLELISLEGVPASVRGVGYRLGITP